MAVGASDVSQIIFIFPDKNYKIEVMYKEMLKARNLGEEFYPPNGKSLSPKFEKSEIGTLKKQNEFSPKIKFGGYSLKDSGLEHSKIPAKPVKYIVPAIFGKEFYQSHS